jgi:hypothetical protein
VSNPINPKSDGLIEDAIETTRRFLKAAVQSLEDTAPDRPHFKNPEIVLAAFIQSAAADYTAAAMAQQIRAGLEDLAAALNNNPGTIAENVGSDHPLQPESVDTLRGSLDALTESTQKIAAMLEIVSKRMQAED